MSNNILDIKTPAQAQAPALKSDYGLENLGLSNLNQVYWNLGTEALYEEAVVVQPVLALERRRLRLCGRLDIEQVDHSQSLTSRLSPM